MKLYIKNMVCDRCISIVKAELDKLEIKYESVKLGEVTLLRKLTPKEYKQLSVALKKIGFELISVLKRKLIEKLKCAIADLERNSDEELNTKFSDYISLYMNDNFNSLNTLLSEIKGISIEKCIINHKIELVKGLLLNRTLKLDEIALKMHYSNVSQLSNQFKSITGLTPLNFRRLQYLSSKNTEMN